MPTSQAPVRLLHVHHGTAPGGAPGSLARLLSGLDRQRFESTLILPGGGPLRRKFESMGLPVRTGPLAVFYYLAQQPRVRRSTRLKHTLFAPFNRRFIQRSLQHLKPHVVHLNTALLPVSAAAAAESGIPVLVHVREVIPDDDPLARDYLVQAARNFAGAVVAISEAAAEPFRRGGCDVSVIHEGIDSGAWWRPDCREDVRAEFGADEGDTVILYPAMLAPEKGQRTFLEALPELVRARPRIRIWFAGSEAVRGMEERLKRFSRQAGLERHVTWLGWQADLPRVMSGVDIVAFLPKREEGFGLPVVEAMAAGKPVVAADHGPTREILEPGVTGMIVSPDDANQVRGALMELAGNSSLRHNLGENGRRVASDRFELGTMIREFEAVYDRLAVHASTSGNVR